MSNSPAGFPERFPMTQWSLVAQAGQEDRREALGRLLEQYLPALRAHLVYGKRLPPDRADDLLQETYYRFLRAGAVHENEAHCRNSLYRTATNLARDARRRQLVRGVIHITGHDVERVPSERDAESSERTADLTRAMARLKPRERSMLWLAYAEGASHQEIAETLGLRPASLKSLLFRARRKLRSSAMFYRNR